VTVADATARALRIKPAALAQRIDQQLRSHRAEAHPVFLVRAEPAWPHEPTLSTADGQRLRVVPCLSALAVWEQLAQARDTTLVLLTNLTERELGTGILSEVFRQRVITVEPWDLVAETFGARLDPRLQAETWVGDALLDAMPAEGWPRLAGTLLSRDHALRYLAAVRLRVDRLGLGPDDLDASVLLRWSALPGADESLHGMRDVERAGLIGWLSDTYGRPARAVFALQDAGHLADALPLGLVCAAVWLADDPEALRAQGRIEQYFGPARLDAATIQAYADAATGVVTDLLRPDADLDDSRAGRAVLDRAEALLVQFGAIEPARQSRLLRTGFDHRAEAVAAALQAALADPTPERTSAAEAVLDEFTRHHLAQGQPHRVERARMALRLLRWLATPAREPESVADGIDRQAVEWGWVDLALAHVWAGDDAHSGLKRALGAVYQRAAERRRHLDQGFAAHLATWVAADTPPGTLLTIERVLDQVVEPLVRQGDQPVLLIVLDGMSAAVAADLAEDLTRQQWMEYDPLASAGDAQRRGALAAIPSVTAVSRTSLFAGELRQGGAADERATFESHPRWRGRPAQLFHKSLIAGGAGEVLDQDLESALADTETLVAVVINTIDDALYHGREGAEPGWRVNQVGPLRTLLDQASYHERAVVITSDHGHVTDRDSVLRTATTPASARHRICPTPPGDGEVELVGPRVRTDRQRAVALWDPAVRYLPQRAGYHGGASLAEMTVPVMTFLPWNAKAPRGWVRLTASYPSWWSAEPLPQLAPRESSRPQRARRPSPPGPPGDALFELVPRRTQSLVEAVLGSEMFAAQHALTPRKVPLPKIRGALAALVDSNGVLPAVAVAEGAGEHPGRASGFITTLQRIFNVDNYPVLSLTDDGRTVRLELSLLREQFGVGEAGR
jgi:hypothetical protein